MFLIYLGNEEGTTGEPQEFDWDGFYSERLVSANGLVKEHEQWCGKPSDLFRDFVDSALNHVFYNRNDDQ